MNAHGGNGPRQHQQQQQHFPGGAGGVAPMNLMAQPQMFNAASPPNTFMNVPPPNFAIPPPQGMFVPAPHPGAMQGGRAFFRFIYFN